MKSCTDCIVFVLHGGATTIAKNLIAPNKERLLKLHGRWKTDICKDMYKEDTAERLVVSKSLNI